MPSQIFLPVIAMIALTVGIALWMLMLRIGAVRAGQLSPKYFRLNRGGKEPERLTQVTQHYHNLLELPPLFYIAAVTVYALQLVDAIYLTLAWAYVGFRLLHAAVHTTYNHVMHRLMVFLGSVAMLVAIWARLGFQLVAN